MSIDWTSPREGRRTCTYGAFASAKCWFFRRWSAWSHDRGLPPPADLSGSCKHGSLFMQSVYGGGIRGQCAHPYNFIDGRVVDLRHDALDVGRMRQPSLHEPAYFLVPELQDALTGCEPRAQRCRTASGRPALPTGGLRVNPETRATCAKRAGAHGASSTRSARPSR